MTVFGSLHSDSQSEGSLQDSQTNDGSKSRQVSLEREVSNSESYYKYRMLSDEQLKHGTFTQEPFKTPEVFTMLKLNFTVTRAHLRAGDRQLGLKCSASVLDLYWRSGEVNTQVVDRSRYRYHGHFSSGHGGMGLADIAFIAEFVISVCCNKL